MKVWLVQIAEPLPSDGAVRLLRTGLMAEALARDGAQVLWWTSTFDHTRKVQRFAATSRVEVSPNYSICALKSVSYRRNVSLARIANNVHLGRVLRDAMRRESPPDVIVASFPTIEFCSAAAAFAREHGIPVVMDVRDMWPDVMVELAPAGLHFLARGALAPYFRYSGTVLRAGTALTGLSPPFLQWAAQRAGRELTGWDRVFAMAYSERVPAPERVASLTRQWRETGVGANPEELTCVFFGTLGQQFDLETVIDAAARLERSGARCRFVLCGAGDRLEALRASGRGLQSVTFPGWVGADEIWTLMRLGHLGLAPYRRSDNFAMNFPNKPAEYLSAGLPVVTPAGGYLADKLARNDCGVHYEPGEAAGLAATLAQLSASRARVATMARNAQALYQQEFVAERVYADYAKYLGQLVRHHVADSTPAVSRAGS